VQISKFLLSRSQSSLSSSSRFRRIVIVNIIYCVVRMQSLENSKDLSMRTGTCELVLDDEDFPRGQQHCLSGDLANCHYPCDLLRCVTYDVMVLADRTYSTVALMLYSVASVVCLSVRNVLWLNGAS